MPDDGVVLEALSAAAVSTGEGLLHLSSSHLPVVRPLDQIVWSVGGPAQMVGPASADLPDNAARAEAIAVRLRRAGVPLEWGPPRTLATRALAAACRSRGEASIAVIRADPTLLTEMQVGGWFNAGPRGRLVRRALLRLPRFVLAALPARFAADVAFWSGARTAASRAEWRRLTRSGYVSLCYHRIAGDHKPGQERLDLAPRRFRRQMLALRLAGFRPLTPDELLRFHTDPAMVLGRRRFVLTTDDAFADCVGELARNPGWQPHVYVPTQAVGGRAVWADEEAVADWPALVDLHRRGGVIGSHTRTHAGLRDLEDRQLADELGGALEDLRSALGEARPLLAYPHGRHDERVRRAARRAGYRLAWTTDLGRNAAGTDPFCLRRVGPKHWHGALAILYLAVTGTLLPRPLERGLSRRSGARIDQARRPGRWREALGRARRHPRG